AQAEDREDPGRERGDQEVVGASLGADRAGDDDAQAEADERARGLRPVDDPAGLHLLRRKDSSAASVRSRMACTPKLRRATSYPRAPVACRRSWAPGGGRGASASARGSAGGTMMPPPSARISRPPPTSVAIPGRPCAMPSRTAFGIPSVYEASTATSA